MAMALAVVPIPTLGVLAPFLVNELGISATQLGLAAAAFGLVGGLTAPRLGRAADRLGPKGALTLLFAINTGALLVATVAFDEWVLILALAIAGLSQGVATSATNITVSELVSVESWGLVTGIKEAGVPAGALIAGVTLPLIAVAAGWRAGFFTFALVSAACLLLVQRLFNHERPKRASRFKINDGDLSPFVNRLALFAFFVGFGTNALLTFLPLFAEAALGFEVVPAGLLVAAAGTASVIGRVGWSAVTARWDVPRIQLMAIAFLALVATLLLAVSSGGVSWLIWIGAVVFGLSAFSWTSVGAMAVIRNVAPETTGLATGRLILGFGVGLGVGPIAFGWLVDASQSFLGSFLLLAAVYLAALVTMAASKHAFGAIGRRL